MLEIWKKLDIWTKIKVISVILFIIALIIVLLDDSSSSSSYSLHNSDGTLNTEYVNDMNEYFEKHPEKLPK